MNRKGLAIETVVLIVLAIVGLVIIWIFLSKVTPAITSMAEDIIKGIACQICNALGLLKYLVGGVCWGC
jgi:hypothetical protein